MGKLYPLAGERQPRETSSAIRACNDFLLSRRRGPGALKELWQRYAAIARHVEQQPPTRSWSTLQTWSSRYEWSARAELYDVEQEGLRKEAQKRATEAAWEVLYDAVPKAVKVLVKLIDVVAHVDDASTIENPAQARLAAKDVLRLVLADAEGSSLDEAAGGDAFEWEVFEERIVRYARRYRTDIDLIRKDLD